MVEERAPLFMQPGYGVAITPVSGEARTLSPESLNRALAAAAGALGAMEAAIDFPADVAPRLLADAAALLRVALEQIEAVSPRDARS